MRDASSALLVGQSVKAVRVAIGWTQRELAARASVSQAYVCLIENGRVEALTFEAADRLLHAMGARLAVSVDKPFLGDRERQREPLSRRTAWLRPLHIDDRRSPAPHADYADFMGTIERGRGGTGKRHTAR